MSHPSAKVRTYLQDRPADWLRENPNERWRCDIFPDDGSNHYGVGRTEAEALYNASLAYVNWVKPKETERRIFAALEPAPVAPAEAWQPIETAPKDGQMILVCLPRMMNLIVRARFDTVHGYWLHDYEGEGGVSRYFSLHSGDVWLPMPKPPRALADAGEAG